MRLYNVFHNYRYSSAENEEDESYRQLQNFLLEEPLAGDVIQGTVGLRKLRWSANGKGKRGGI